MDIRAKRERFGERIRAVRKAQSLSLSDVEKKSNGAFKSVVLGSYERGVRAMSVDRCQSLADIYGVPVSVLFGETASADAVIRSKSSREIFDLKKIRSRASNELRHDLDKYQPLARYFQRLCAKRGDWNGEVLSIRDSDIENLQLLIGVNSEELSAWIAFEGLTLKLAQN